MHIDRQKDSENERASVTVENINKRIQKNVDAESTYVRKPNDRYTHTGPYIRKSYVATVFCVDI